MAQDKQQPQEAQAITIDTSGYNPALDPSSPDFDVKAWRKAVDDMGGVTELEKRLTADLTEPADRARAYMNLTMGQFVQLSKEEQYLFWQQPAIAKQFESVRSRIKETAAALDESYSGYD